MVGIAFIDIIVSQYTKVITIKGDFPPFKNKKGTEKRTHDNDGGTSNHMGYSSNLQP